MVSGDGTVAVTQVFRQPRGLLVDSFDSKEDLINALHTSCFIPGYRFAVSKPTSAILFFALMFSLLWFGKDICRYLNSIWSTLEKTWENEEISAVMETTVQCLVLNVSMFCVQVLGTKASDYFPRSCLHWWRPDTFHAPYSCWQNSMYSQTFSPRVPIQCMCIRSQFWRMECIGFDHELLLLISTARFLRYETGNCSFPLICQTPASSIQHAGSDVSEVVICPFGSFSGSHERELGCEFQWVKC